MSNVINEATRKTVQVITSNDDDYLVSIIIPTGIKQGSEDEWKYICTWVDAHCINAVEWRD